MSVDRGKRRDSPWRQHLWTQWRQRTQSQHWDVQVEDLQEIVGQHQQQPTIQEMLEEDEEQEEQQPTQEDDVKPGEPTTRQLTELLTNTASL
ncbi:hypothetical protein Hamer_G024727 [Homarus americanus]|uniref:Uncharacterized protein n=1 Tax=Homarus americanus TaxID=6706 RepID=A0A8J5N983_HOMAM|nr:hypothetical protein Hamer_G024727 [Homarus americanus]